MSRREFSKRVMRDAFLRAGGRCEGDGCGARLTPGKFAYDHIIPDALGGEPTPETNRYAEATGRAMPGRASGQQSMSHDLNDDIPFGPEVR